MRAGLILTLGCAALLAAPGHAAVCTAIAGPIAFGLYDTVQAAPGDTSGLLQVTCTPSAGDPLITAYTIGVAGSAAAQDATRSLAWGAHRLYFQLYTDASRSTPWGSGGLSSPGVASSVASAAPLVPATRSHTVYARMPARQSVPPGAYAGSLLVTIEY